MIGKIKGVLTEIEGNVGLIDTSSGLSYYIYLTPGVLNKYKEGDNIEIYTHLQVKEDDWLLFGFLTKQEHKLFKLLISISGVGPKTAFSIISFSNPIELVQSIKDNNVGYLTRIPHLGKKTAMKIALELSHKFETEFKMEKMYLSEEDKTVVEALVSLGFKTQDAKNILSQIPNDLSLEEKIKQALKLTTSGKKRV